MKLFSSLRRLIDRIYVNAGISIASYECQDEKADKMAVIVSFRHARIDRSLHILQGHESAQCMVLEVPKRTLAIVADREDNSYLFDVKA